MIAKGGLFITIDGPNGVGKSSIIGRLSELLTAMGPTVYLTKEPTNSNLGQFIRDAEEEYLGMSLAYLIAADRTHHIEHEIEPAIKRGEIVISDRYICSSLALQRLDGLNLDFIWSLNRNFLIPDLTIILTAQPEVLHKRLVERRRMSRFEKTKSRSEELQYFLDAYHFLKKQGHNVLMIENGNISLEDNARNILTLLDKNFLHPAGV